MRDARGGPPHARSVVLRSRRIGLGIRRTFQLRQNPAQRRDQLVPRYVALLELNPELERFVLRLKLEDERLRTLRDRLFFLTFAPRLIAGQATLKDAMHHFNHLLL